MRAQELGRMGFDGTSRDWTSIGAQELERSGVEESSGAQEIGHHQVGLCMIALIQINRLNTKCFGPEKT